MRLFVDLPSGLAPLPLDEDTTRRSAAAEALALTGAVPEKEVGVSNVLATSDLLARTDLLFAGVLCLHDADPSVFATVELSVRELPSAHDLFDQHESEVEFARALADALTHTNPDAVVQYRNLGCGPTVLILRASRFALPGNLTVTGDAVQIPTDSLQAIVPLQDPPGIAVLNFSSTSRDWWPRFVELALTMVDSIRVAPSDPFSSDRSAR